MAAGISQPDFLEALDEASKLNIQALMLEETGHYREALEIYKTVADTRKADFGELHFEVVKLNFRIARILYKLDENEKALPMFEDIYSKIKVISGPEDGDVIRAGGYLANILRKTGKAALPIYEEIHEIQSRKYPLEPMTWITKTNMALEICDQGKFNKSIRIFDGMLNLLSKINSAESEIFSTCVREHMMWVLCKQGKYSEALHIGKTLHEKEKISSGENHPSTVKYLNDVALVLADKGEYDQAESALKVVLNENRKQENKLHFFRNQYFLALVLKKNSKLDESLHLFKDQYELLKTQPSNPIYLFTTKLIAKIVDHQGKYEEALRLYEEIMKMDEPGSPDSSITLKNMKRIMVQRGKSSTSGPSPHDLYQIESKMLWEIIEDAGKNVEDYP